MKLDSICNQVYVVALNEARIQNHEYITPEHFLYAALMFDVGKEIISKSGGNLKNIQNDLIKFFENTIPKKVSNSPVDSFEFVRMFELATAQAHGNGKQTVILGNILVAMFNLPESFASYIMLKNGVDRLFMLKLISSQIEKERSEQENQQANNVKETEQELLKNFTVNLTEKARNGLLDPLIGRETIIERTIQVLSRRLKNNPIHVGDPGVGKTAIVEGIAQKIANEDVPQILKNSQIYYIDMSAVVAGTKYRGDFEDRLIKLMDALSRVSNPIVYIDEIHTVVGAGAVSGGGIDATSILKPYLAKGDIRFIGSTTFEEYKKYFEKDRALSRRFQKIDIPEPAIDESIKILKGIKEKYEYYHNVTYSDDIIRLVCELAEKYMNDRFMPDKAIDIIDETGAYLRMCNYDGVTKSVSDKDIERTVALMAKIPQKTVSGKEIDKLKNLEECIKSQIFGQDEAVKAVVYAIKASRSGLNDAEKPVASLLFVGPTGVGKTEIAKQLADNLNVKLIRYDMSEYQEKHSVARLIGAPPGYVGYEEGGLLTEAIRKTPHCVLLLDEIEKAHPDIYNVLLQIMDYGSLTDNIGKKADFRNVIVIMTSNAGAKEIGKRVIGYENKKVNTSAIDKEVERIFNPEFRNRLDDIIVFKHIDNEMAKLITTKAINRLGERLSNKHIKIKITEEAEKYISSKGFSEEYGAREIIRVVDKEVKKLLVDEVLFGKLCNGGTATVDYKNNKIVLRSRAKK